MSEPQLQALALQHGFSVEAVRVLYLAMQQSNGTMSHFDHPELGGHGQWMGGMVMIGDMFNSALQDRVVALCGALARLPLLDTP